MDENRKKALEVAFAQIEKQFGKGSIMRLGENTHLDVEAISTGSLSLDLALGIGGIPKGRIVEIYGPESSGKTTIALHIIAEAQKNLENLNVEKQQERIQAQIDALQLQKDILEALPNQAELEQTKKIWELWAADKNAILPSFRMFSYPHTQYLDCR